MAKYTLETKISLVKSFKKSGLTMSEFCSINNVSTSSLYRWTQEIDKNNPRTKKVDTFIPLQVKQTKIVDKQNSEVTIELPNSTVIKFFSNTELSYIIQVIKAVN